MEGSSLVCRPLFCWSNHPPNEPWNVRELLYTKTIDIYVYFIYLFTREVCVTSHKSELCSHLKKSHACPLWTMHGQIIVCVRGPLSCRPPSHCSSPHRALSLLHSTWWCRDLHHSLCTFCQELLFASFSPFSTYILFYYRGGREGTCEVKEVKAGVEEMVVALPSLPRQHCWG